MGVLRNKFKLLGIIAAVLVISLVCTYVAGLFRGTPEETGFVIDTSRVVVIDPGHGGEDGGAVSLNGIFESDINLDIAKRLDQIMGLCGVAVVMTRETAELTYPDDADTIRKRKVSDLKRRADLVNSTDNAVLISIHQNKYSSTQPSGAQVFYAATTQESHDFAVFLQGVLKRTLNPANKRTAVLVSEDVYLMKNVKCTAVMVECGFLSNPVEEALLRTDSYKLKVAWAIASAYLGFYGGANES